MKHTELIKLGFSGNKDDGYEKPLCDPKNVDLIEATFIDDYVSLMVAVDPIQVYIMYCPAAEIETGNEVPLIFLHKIQTISQLTKFLNCIT